MARRKKDDTGGSAGAGGKVNAAVVLKHMSDVLRAQGEHKTLGSEVQTLHKRAKADGLNLDALKLAMKLLRMDSADAVQLYKLAGVYVECRSPGLLKQGDLFQCDIVPAMPETLSEMDIREVEAAGKRAGLKGAIDKGDHGHEAGSEEAQAWERGWLAGEADRKAAEGPDRQTVAPRRRGRPSNADVAARKASEAADEEPDTSDAYAMA